MNENENLNGTATTEGQQGAPQVTQQQTQTVPQQQTEQAEKKGFKVWLKQHWKGVTATIVGTGAAVVSAVEAYKKGKAAGVASVPVQQQDADDFSLNPNE